MSVSEEIQRSGNHPSPHEPMSAVIRRGRSRKGRPHWTVELGVTVFATIVIILLLTPWIAPHDPAAQDLAHRLSAPSAAHWFGTDNLGRDVLSRLMFGGRFSVSITVLTLLLSGTIGTVVGAISARLGGVFDEITMRITDVLISFPDVLIALLLSAILGPGYRTLVLALAIVGWTPFARLTRGLTLEINATGYIEAAEALGCSRRFIIFRHVIPNVARPVLALAFLRFGQKLITVGALSYLGLGVQPPGSDWGAMLAAAQPYMQQVPLLVIVPGAAIFITVLSVTIAGQGLGMRREFRNRARRTAVSEIVVSETEDS